MEFPVTAHNRPNIRYAWCGPALLITDNQGNCGNDPLTGFFFRETRYLSRLRLLLNGEEPFPCSVAEVNPHTLEYSHIYPPVESGGGGGSGSGASGSRHGILFRDIDLDLRFHVHPASIDVVLSVTNRWQERAEFELAWELDADFAGNDEAQSGRRQQEAPVERIPQTDGLAFRYMHPQLALSTRVLLEGPVDSSFAGGRLSTRVELNRQQTVELRLRIQAFDENDDIGEQGWKRREEHLEHWRNTVTRLSSPADSPLTSLTNTALQDLGSLALLEGSEEAWMTPAAGVPLYPALFGRDSLTAAWQAAIFDRGQMVRASLARLRVLQGERIDDWRDEEPGRIIQQSRSNPTARLGKSPHGRYYGDFAAPLMFIIGLGQLYAWSGNKRDLEDNWGAANRIIEWARRYGDQDGDGYLEYVTRSSMGPKHQGWKDSDNAMVHSDGRQAETPIAPCEIQGYWYAAMQFMAVLSGVMGDLGRSRELWQEAEALKERFNRDFWLAEEGFVALGLDAEKQPLRALTSNAAQCITTGIVGPEHLPRLVERIFRSDLYSGWGLRTLSTDNPAYNPLSYHLGSVWAVENGTILFGLKRYGFDEEAETLARSLYELALSWEGNRIPECVGGYARSERGHPGAYPRANSPQAWNRSTFAILVQTLLGMRPVAALGILAIDPKLPSWLPELTLTGLTVGESRFDLHFWRNSNGHTEYEADNVRGKIRIVRQPPLNSQSAGLWDRMTALID